jgi:DNA protecting protein DprA
MLSEHKVLDDLYYYSRYDFMEKLHLSERIATLIVEGLAQKDLLTKELELIEKYQISVASFIDAAYPELLKNIYCPPIVLYWKGAPLLNEDKRLAIVGARKANAYAATSLKKLIPPLVEKNYHIVSGGAMGVDSMAHSQTLAAQGKTIVVFGSGLLHTYPLINKELFRAVIRNNGTLVSIFPLSTPPAKHNFPNRNRIISGLSNGCVVIQAGPSSGALITAKFALDQGRQIFALPGTIHDELSDGCHRLIQQGAKLITNAQDILDEFGDASP